MGVEARIQKIEGPNVAFNCPHCKKQSVEGKTRAVVEEYKLLYFIPLGTRANSFIKCTACNREHVLKLELNQLEGLGVEEVTRKVVGRVHQLVLLSVLLSVLAILFCWIPYFGLTLSLIALGFSFKQAGITPKLLPLVALVLCGALHYSFSSANRERVEQCAAQARRIVSFLESGNQCSTNKDCYQPKMTCEFDCEALVNRKLYSKLAEDLLPYQKNCKRFSECENDCPAPSGVVACHQGKCILRNER